MVGEGEDGERGIEGGHATESGDHVGDGDGQRCSGDREGMREGAGGTTTGGRGGTAVRAGRRGGGGWAARRQLLCGGWVARSKCRYI